MLSEKGSTTIRLCRWTMGTGQVGLERFKSRSSSSTMSLTVPVVIRCSLFSFPSPSDLIVGDYGGPMFLLPGLVYTCYITGTDLGEERRHEMKRYIRNHQNRDGGWGLHIEGESSMKGSTLNYVALRLLGEDAKSEAAIHGRKWIESHGGALCK